MNLFSIIASSCLALIICVISTAQAGGDKSAKTTVITLAGGGDKSHGGYPIPIPVPVCTGGHGGHGGHGGRGYGGHGGGYQHHGGFGGAQARIGGWRR